MISEGAFGEFGEDAVPVAGGAASADIQYQGRKTSGQDMECRMVTMDQ